MLCTFAHDMEDQTFWTAMVILVPGTVYVLIGGVVLGALIINRLRS